MPRRVLIIESGMEVFQALARYFEERDDEVWQARKLDEAVSLMDLVQPDLLLMDIHLPGEAWLNFLSQTKEKYPDLKIVLTSKQIDLHREILAKQRGVESFLRQPYTHYWLEQAIKSTEEHNPLEKQGQPTPPLLPPVYLSMRFKIILPFVILTVVFGLLFALINAIKLNDASTRLSDMQLTRSGKQAAYWLADNEEKMVTSLEALSSIQGLADLMIKGDEKRLTDAIKPVLINHNDEAVEILAQNGKIVFSLHANGDLPLAYGYESQLNQQRVVQMTLKGMSDRKGDKFAFLVKVAWGNYLYYCSPVYGAENQPVGVILVGRNLTTLSAELKRALLGDIFIYDSDGRGLVSTSSKNVFVTIPDEQRVAMMQNQAQSVWMRQMGTGALSGNNEVLLFWKVRDSEIIGYTGLMIPAVSGTFIDYWTLFETIGLIILMVLVTWQVGKRVAQMFSKPIQRLIASTLEVNNGNLVTKVEPGGKDELSVLIHSFNSMLLGLQQKLIYRDLMGYIPSPGMQETIRKTFDSPKFNLRGKETTATLLITNVRDFTDSTQHLPPEKVVELLNDYFERLADVAVLNGGMIYKLDSDAIMVIFGVLPSPLSPDQSAFIACKSALAMLTEIDLFNQKYEREHLPPFTTDIAVHTGRLGLGGLSIRDQLHYTPFGSTLKITHSLVQISRKNSEQSNIVISQDTFDALGNQKNAFELDYLDRYDLKTDHGVTRVYRLMAISENM
jgi:class 3 adenylate cyclase/CheY-like chemotaxis protein